MKKILLITATALLAATAFAQPKFAHVNTTELVQLCPEMDKARETMNTASTEAQETYQAMVDEFNSKYSTYQSKASTWTDAIRQSKEKELTEIQQRIQEFQQTVQVELQQQQEQLMQPIYTKVNETIQDLAKKGGYIFVFDSGAVLYVDATQSTDLTPEARKVLNIPADRTLESLAAELQAQQQAAAATAQ
ncbi:MAG: OmpH family outer membrane protein [Bacteroidales bacterium]|nr:OmpH family outer membrane protein [Bacteroidales bacterium]